MNINVRSAGFSVLFFSLPFVLPKYSISFDSGTVFTVISILFTILIGFFIASAMTNYFRLQDLISRLNAGMISLQRYANIIAPSRANQVADVIDRYLIATLDYDLLNYSNETRDEFDGIIDCIDQLRPEPKAPSQLLQNIHSVKCDFIEINQEIMLASQTIVGPRHWSILIALAFAIGLLAIPLREGGLLPTCIVGIILVANYQVLRLLYDIDTNLFLTKRLAFQNPQQVFRAIHRLPYFPQFAIDRKNVIHLPSSYRVGMHLPGSKVKKIRLVTTNKRKR